MTIITSVHNNEIQFEKLFAMSIDDTENDRRNNSTPQIQLNNGLG